MWSILLAFRVYIWYIVVGFKAEDGRHTMTKTEVVEALRNEARYKVRLATQSLGRSPTTANLDEAVFLLDEAVPILQVASRMRGELDDE